MIQAGEFYKFQPSFPPNLADIHVHFPKSPNLLQELIRLTEIQCAMLTHPFRDHAFVNAVLRPSAEISVLMDEKYVEIFVPSLLSCQSYEADFFQVPHSI